MVANMNSNHLTDCDQLTQRFTNTFLEDLTCVRCGDGFNINEQLVNSGSQTWHAECFV